MARSRIPHEVDTAVINDNASSPEVSTFAKTLNALLVEKNIHQEDLARALGISTGTISYYRSGKKEPRLSRIIKIADYLNVDCHYLMTGTKAENVTTAREIGLSDAAINKVKSFRDKAALSAVLESQNLFVLITAIADSAKYADNRGYLIGKHMTQVISGQKATVPPEDMDYTFLGKTIDATVKLFREVSARLYDEKEGGE